MPSMKKRDNVALSECLLNARLFPSNVRNPELKESTFLPVIVEILKRIQRFRWFFLFSFRKTTTKRGSNVIKTEEKRQAGLGKQQVHPGCVKANIDGQTVEERRTSRILILMAAAITLADRNIFHKLLCQIRSVSVSNKFRERETRSISILSK